MLCAQMHCLPLPVQASREHPATPRAAFRGTQLPPRRAVPRWRQAAMQPVSASLIIKEAATGVEFPLVAKLW